MLAADFEAPFAVAATVLGIAALLGGAWVTFRGKRTSTTLDAQSNAMTTLEHALHIERTERHEDNRRCNERISHLQGQVSALTNGLADTIARAVVAHIDAMESPRRRRSDPPPFDDPTSG